MTEIRFAGFGGQGIILAGFIAGKAAVIYDGKEAALTQSYGPEARGGACSADVVVSAQKVDYPKVTTPDVAIIMSQDAYATYGPSLRPDTLLIIDSDLVVVDDAKHKRLCEVPATRITEKLGRKLVANIVMLGALAALSDAVSADALKRAVLDSVPKGTEELNTKAFQAGFDHARAPRT